MIGGRRYPPAHGVLSASEHEALMAGRGGLATPPITGATSLPAWVQEVSARIDLDALCEVVVERDISAAFPRLAGDPDFAGQLRASARQNLLTLQDLICGRASLDEARLEQPLAFAAVQARLRIPQTALQRSYRVGFLAKWEEWSRQVGAFAEQADVSRAEALRALTDLASLIFGYQDYVASQVAETYARADNALNRSRVHVRQALVRELLRGDATSLPPSDLLTLDYDLTAQHLVLLLPALAEGAATQLLFGLRAATRAQHSLVHPLSLSSTAVWLGARSPWTGATVRALRAVLDRTGVEAALSDPVSELSGFRAGLVQAQEVQRVRLAWGEPDAPRVLQHAEVRLEVLLLRDPEGTRAFVRAELGPLADATAEAARLRHTLEASFRYGSHVAAAQYLQLHEHTVRNRLHKAEEQLGYPLHERHTEIQVALRLLGVLTAVD